MKKYDTMEDELLKVKSLIGIANLKRSSVVQKSNEILKSMPKQANNKWKLKTKIVLFIGMIMIGVEHDKEIGIQRLKEVLRENPELCGYYLEISQKLKMVANLPT